MKKTDKKVVTLNLKPETKTLWELLNYKIFARIPITDA
jgi:DNA-directed RNA polymerase subunit L